jgi:hypothetical protein
MRADLCSLKAAGIKRARFSARVQQVTPQGNISLFRVFGPVGFTQHCWVKEEDWHGPKPRPGAHVEFCASIESYWKGAGEEDLCLTRVEVVE